ncbi:sensor histidine kinase [Nocardioides sp. Soil805]|uniref:sensor histidine kinase n=1 Tax=Nocardioides sp. Soil805 TaxID=1736416 RepID=UPI00138F0F89|nr:histidine kinase [Nocardioides sp. Soil805]
MLTVIVGTAAAVAFSRRAPGVALMVVWAVYVVQLLGGTPPMLVQVAIAYVAFGTTRWGSTATVWLSGLSIPAAGLVVYLALVVDQSFFDVPTYGGPLDLAFRLVGTWQAVTVLFATLLLAGPWLLGLVARYDARARQSRVSQVAAEQDAATAHREATQALEIARLRDEQAQLARDVHDVVGHSLAVILAQAESAQFLPDDPEGLKKTMRTIASSARTSLQDVRHVLTSTQEPVPHPGEMEELVENVRSSGHDVDLVDVGTPRPLPPELDAVAYRVLQEMLTNAIRHGRRDEPISVERQWHDELRLEVRNAVDETDDETAPMTAVGTAHGGRGLDGMGRRLASVGGRLHVQRRDEDASATFTATAWIPLRAVQA